MKVVISILGLDDCILASDTQLLLLPEPIRNADISKWQVL